MSERRKTIQVIICNRTKQNADGAKLEHPDLYHQKLMLKTGSYVKACTIMFVKFRITFFIDIREVKD